MPARIAIILSFMLSWVNRTNLGITLVWFIANPVNAMDLSEAYRHALQHDARFWPDRFFVPVA